MGFIPRRRIKENLREVEVFLEDRDNRIIKVQDIPDTFVQGRSAFKIFGSEFLKPNVPLKIEILDKAGNTVWTQPVKYGQQLSPKLPYRFISVEVYPPPFNVPGEAELIILGEVDETKIPVDPQFIGTYNVRYRKTINIDTEKIINEQPILFYKKPQITATELVKAQKKTAAPNNAYISGSQIYGIVNSDVQGTAYDSGSDTNTQTDTNDTSQTPTGDLETQANLWKYKTGLYKKNKMLKRRGLKKEKQSPEPPQMTLYLNNDQDGLSTFNTKLVGGNITITDIKIPSASAQTLSGLSSDQASLDTIYNSFTFPNFIGKVENVISDTELTVTQPYSVEYKDPLGTVTGTQRIYSDIGSNTLKANFTASYVDWEVPSTSSYRFDSFIDFKVEDMRTFSGDVFRIKISGGSDSSQGDFPVLLDTIVDAPELLVDSVSPSGVLRSGYFIGQTHLDKYWNAYGGDNNTNTLVPYYTMSLADGMYLSGSYETYNQVGRAELDSTYAFTVKKDVAYTLTFNAKGKKATKNDVNGNSYQSAKMFLHLSGSNLKDSSNLEIQYASSFGHTITNEFGQPVGLQIDDNEQITTYKDFGRISHTFTPNFKLDRIKNTDTILQLRIHSGEWLISDISLQPATSTGFSPDEFVFRVPIQPNTLRPDNFDFLIEYLDINGNTAETLTFLDNVKVSGSALILEGTDNLLTGSMFMGNVQDSGIEMAGATSAFVRSVGYKGFVSASVGGEGGFMIWSGSVLPNSPDNYTGAGLEIHDGITGSAESFFKFRTIDANNDYSSSFAIKTSRFFLGSEVDGNFVSGALGNIEISSSNFHLTPEGNVTMSGAITAEGGTIAGWEISDDYISKALTGHSTSATSRIYLANTENQTQNIGQGLTIYRDDDDTDSGDVKIIRVGQLSNVGNLHATASNDYGIQVIKNKTATTYENILYIGKTQQQIAGWDLSSTRITSPDGDMRLTSGNPKITIGTHTVGNGPGIQLGYDSGGTLTFFAGQSATDYIKYTAGTGIDIQTDTLKASGSSIILEAPKFFLGGSSQFVSGSTGNIEISSSNFHLTPEGDVTMSGVITAEGGTLGGFTIGDTTLTTTGVTIGNATEDLFISSSAFKIDHTGNVTASNMDLGGKISATSGDIGGWTIESGQLVAGTGNSSVTMSGDLGIIAMGSGSTFQKGQSKGGMRVGIDTDGQFKFIVGSQGSYIHADNDGVSIKSDSFDVTASVAEINVDDFGLNANNLVITSSTQYIAAGAAVPSGIGGTNKGFFLKGDTGQILVGDAAGAHFSFDGTNASVSSSAFYFGNDTNFISGSTGNIQIQSSGTTTLSGSAVNLLTDKFYFGNASNYISGSTGNIKIYSAGTTTLSGSEVNLLTDKFYFGNSSNYISGSTGNIKIFSSGTTTLSGSAVTLATPRFYFGNASNYISGSTGNIKIFNTGTTTLSGSEVTIETPKFFLGKKSSQYVSGSDGTLEISSSNFHLTSAGTLIASNATLAGAMTANTGYIGGTSGWTIASGKITAAGIGVATTTGDGTYAFWAGNNTPASAEFSVAHTGALKSTSGEVGGWAISTTLSATNILLDPTTPKITLGSKSTLTDSNAGLYLGTDGMALGASSVFKVTAAGHLTSTSATIGGWEVGSDEITGGDMIIRSDGTIESSGFESNVVGSGFRLTAASGGFLEVENARIRGTLSTAVFEKETVNAVGGQLYVANATTLTGSVENPSGYYSATEETMSVVNVTGFAIGEILSAKKIHATGFGTEYFYVESASRNDSSSDTNYSGKLYVERAYGNTWVGDSGSLGDTPGGGQTYTGSQVIVSTGKVGTGYIRLNANPNDPYTPYIDIVERTGSSIYAVDLKARLGDLSGLSSAHLHGTNPTGQFGLYSKNVYLEGGIVANTGSIAGIEMTSGKLYTGAGNFNNSDTGFYIDSGSDFSLGDKLVWDASEENLAIAGSITITGGPTAASIAALNSETSSLSTSLTALGQATASLQATTASLLTSTTALATATSSLGNQITGAVESGSAFAGNAVTSASYYASGAVASGSLYATNAEATASLIGVSAEASASAYGSGAVASGSLYATNAEATASLIGASAEASASAYGTGAAASASAVQTNLDSGLASVSASVSGAFSSVSESITSRIMTDISGALLDVAPAPAGEGLFLNYPYMGFFSSSAAGDQTTDGWSAFISSSGGFLFKADNDNLISFGQEYSGGDGASTKSFVLKSDNVYLSGSKINMLADKFYLGNDNTFISGSDGNIKVSGSNVDILTNKFFLGNPTSHISGSANGVKISGSYVAISTDKFYLGNSSTFISGSTGNIKVSGSNIDILTNKFFFGNSTSYVSGSATGVEISGSNIDILTPKFYLGNSSQYISGSTGKIQIKSDNFELDTSGNVNAQGSSHHFGGTITANVINATGSGLIGGWTIDSDSIHTGTKDSTGYTAGAGDITLYSDGSNAGIHTNKFYVDSSGNAAFKGTLTIDSTLSEQISGSQNAASASMASSIAGTLVDSGSIAAKIQLTSTGMNVLNSDDVAIAQYGASATIGLAADARTVVTSTAISMYSGKISGTSYKRVAIDNTGKAAFGGAVDADVSVTSTDDVVRIMPGGGVAIYEDSNNYASMSSDGMKLYAGGALKSTFGSTVVLGTAGQSRTEISDTAINMYDGAVSPVARVNLDSSGNLTLGQAGQSRTVITDTSLNMYDGAVSPVARVNLDSSGNLTLGQAGEARTVITDSSISMYSGQSTTYKRVAIDSTGKAAFGGAADADVSTISTDDVVRIMPGGGVAIYEDSNNYASMSSAGMKLYQGGNQVATFGSTITLAPDVSADTTDSIKIAAGGVKIYDNQYEYVHIGPTGFDVYTDISSAAVKVAQFGTTTVIGSSTVVSDSSTDDCIRIADGTVSIFQDDNNKATVTSAGMKLWQGGNQVATFGSTITLAPDVSAATTDSVVIGAGGVKVYDSSADYIHVSSSGLSVWGGSVKRASIASTGIILAQDVTTPDADSVVIASGGVKIYDDSTSFIHITADGLKVYDGDASNPNAVFGATTYVGLQASEHVKITASKLELKRGSETFVSASSAGLYTSGSVNANSGIIGGWTIVSGSMESNTSNYRGIKIKVNKGVSGFGSSAHSKSTTVGKFSFGVAPVPGGNPGGGGEQGGDFGNGAE